MDERQCPGCQGAESGPACAACVKRAAELGIGVERLVSARADRVVARFEAGARPGYVADVLAEWGSVDE
jgi:hypothetical protein